jgi:ubiquinone/menaquinone biosynthesis C-methylase UbiE
MGVDIAPNLLEQARQRAAAEKVDAVFYEGGAEQLSYDGGVFTSRTLSANSARLPAGPFEA